MDKEFWFGMLTALLILMFALAFFSVGYGVGSQGKVQTKEVMVEQPVYYPAPFDIKVSKNDVGDIMINGELK